MNIYVSHSSSFDFVHELYQPLKDHFGAADTLILPHEADTDGMDARELIRGADIVLAEVSYPSTGQGIELGWADVAGIRIIAFNKADAKPSGALNFLTADLFEYVNSDDLLERLAERLN